MDNLSEVLRDIMNPIDERFNDHTDILEQLVAQDERQNTILTGMLDNMKLLDGRVTIIEKQIRRLQGDK